MTSPLFGIIPSSELQEHQIARKNGQDLPTYQFLRAPSTIDELAHYQNGAVIWMEETLVLLNHGEIFEEYSLPKVQLTEYYFALSFLLSDHTKVNCRIFGDVKGVLKTAVFFTSLEVSEGKHFINISISYHRGLVFDYCHTKEFELLFESIANQNYLLSLLSERLCHLFHYDTTISDAFDFPCHLRGRRGAGDEYAGTYDTVWLPGWFEHLQFSEFPGDLVIKLLSSNVPSIGFDIDRRTETLDLSTVNIVSSKIRVLSSSREFPTKFMLSFLHRVAELGQLECFEFNRTDGPPVPDDVKNALLAAVAASKKLTKLTLSSSDESLMWDGLVEDLFGVLEKHEALRTLRITPYPTTLDPQFAWLKQSYKRNRYIDVTDSSGDKLEADDEVDQLLAVNHFFRGSEKLKKEPTATRLSLLGAALTHSAASDLPRAGLLLMHHLDLICELVHENESTGEAEDVIMEMIGSDRYVAPA
ncbi:hypothetical protein FisN_12Lh073 [Fistulifera solaris]|uniref:Uncharacterized protein n=1 Tax=Fistulifera solaris TaxID=1519565 RepID=A0A1Z5JMH4_FISSO|nr:hypothetical protein FisN_12Lh073 [Fistulifera solaris]|eukprot:GAX15223.1 hypothetical protein FisN_12Lh073 [Fistulifera solaris]